MKISVVGTGYVGLVTGTCLAETGNDPTTTAVRAVWNYDIHVDLRNAIGVAKGTTLGDYDLFLNTNIASSLFFFPIPLDLTFGGFIPADTVLYQLSLNPVFGNTEFDIDAEGTYFFDLVLIPKTFNGPPLLVSMDVVVVDLP